MNKYITWLIVLIVLIGGWYWLSHRNMTPAVSNGNNTGNNSPTSSTTPPVTNNGDLSELYNNPKTGFTLKYPKGYSVNDENLNQIKFTIPPQMTVNTNLGSDTYLSVEKIPNAKTCSAKSFFDTTVKTTSATDNGVTYSVASSTDAGAGNRYEKTVYALPGVNPCVAVVYLVHYAAIENYPAGTIQAFDKDALVNEFDKIRRSLTLVH
jgi:hypothetical protein